MSDPNAYVMLISSLPDPGALFRAKRPPISRLKLDRRLRVLAPEDAQDLKLTEQVLHWGEIPLHTRDEEIVRRATAALAQIEDPTVQLILRDRLEIRTCLAALRRRQQGGSAPAAKEPWGYGRWTRNIRRNWSRTTFGLERIFPWLPEAARLFREGDSLALQRLILKQAWVSANRRRRGHSYDFAAVVAYVVKWNIVDRWSRYNGTAAVLRLDRMTEAALEAQGPLFGEDSPFVPER